MFCFNRSRMSVQKGIAQKSYISMMRVFALALVVGLVVSLPAQQSWAEAPADAVMQSVDVNHADAEAIAQVLKGVGLKKAQAIVAYREENGAFGSIAQLVEVKGIGVALLEKNRGRIALK